MVATKAGVVMRDRVYGSMDFSFAQAELFKTGLLRRLKDVHMSIPQWLLKVPASPTRFEHSCGVAHLANLVTRLPGFEVVGPNLHCAALAHDAATPPFAHCCDPFMERCLRMNHEERACQMIEAEDFSRLARKLGAELSLIKELLRTKWFRGAPDLDNVDNTLRYGLKMRLCERMYDPRDIVQAYCCIDGQLCLKPEARLAVQGWADCRHKVYEEFVYSDDHQAPYLMLRRAIHLAEREKGLPLSFFDMTDVTAYRWLRSCSIKAVEALLALAEGKDYHRCVHRTEETVALLKLMDPLELADDIAQHFKLSPDKICVGYGSNRGQKTRVIPFVDEWGTYSWPPPRGLPTWRLFVFAARGLFTPIEEGTTVTNAEISAYVRGRLDRLLFIPRSQPSVIQQPVLV